MKMKKVLVVCLAVMMVFGLAACGGNDAPADQPTDVQTITGVVNEATAMNTLVLDAEDGTQYIIDTTDVAMNLDEQGLIIGASITVTYEGDLAGEYTVVSVDPATAE